MAVIDFSFPLIDSALRISSPITGSISAAVTAPWCTNIQEELEKIADIQEMATELSCAFDWLAECIDFYFKLLLPETLCNLLLKHAPVSYSVPDSSMWFLSSEVMRQVLLYIFCLLRG